MPTICGYEIEENQEHYLRRGNFGDIFEAKSVKTKGREEPEIKVAAEKIKDLREENLAMIDGLFDTLAQLQSEYLINAVCKEFEKQNEKKTAYWVFMDFSDFNLERYYKRGTEHDKLHEVKLHELKLMEEMTNGVKYLHHNNVVHGDIQPVHIEILMCGEVPTAKITGFHCMMDVSDINETPTEDPFGSSFYMAPELLAPGERGLPLDIFSLGLTFFAMLCYNDDKSNMLPALHGLKDTGLGKNMRQERLKGNIETAKECNRKSMKLPDDCPKPKKEKEILEIIYAMTEFEQQERLIAEQVIKKFNELKISH